MARFPDSRIVAARLSSRLPSDCRRRAAPAYSGGTVWFRTHFAWPPG